MGYQPGPERRSKEEAHRVLTQELTPVLIQKLTHVLTQRLGEGGECQRHTAKSSSTRCLALTMAQKHMR